MPRATNATQPKAVQFQTMQGKSPKGEPTFGFLVLMDDGSVWNSGGEEGPVQLSPPCRR